MKPTGVIETLNRATKIVSILIGLLYSSQSLAQSINQRVDLSPSAREYLQRTYPSYSQVIGSGKTIDVDLVIVEKASVHNNRISSPLDLRKGVFRGTTQYKTLSKIRTLPFNAPRTRVSQTSASPISRNAQKSGIIDIPDPNSAPNCIQGTQHIDITSPDFSIIGQSNYINRFRIGMIYDKTSIAKDETTRAYNLSRRPIKLFVAGSSALSIQIDNPSADNEDKLNAAIYSLQSAIPPQNPQLDFSRLEEVKTLEEFYIKITAGGKCAYGSIDGMFSNEQQNNKYRFYYDFKNEMFTIKATPPVNNHFFENVSAADSVKLYREGVYLNEVTYGRRLIITMETDYASNDLKTDIKASFQYGLYKADTELKYAEKKLRNSLNIKALVIGGNGSIGSAITINSIEELKNLIQKYIEDRNANTALPIAMSFTDLYGNYLSTRISPQENLSYKKCFEPSAKLTVRITSLKADGKNFDLSGQSLIRLYNGKGSLIADNEAKGEKLNIHGDIKIPDGSSFNEEHNLDLIRHYTINTLDEKSTIQLGADFMDRRTFGDEYYKSEVPKIALKGYDDSILNRIARSRDGETTLNIRYQGTGGAALWVTYTFKLE